MILLTQRKTLECPSFKQLLLPALCTAFLVLLGKYLLVQPLTGDFLTRQSLLVTALTAVTVLMLTGCIYSYFCKARIQSYLCAVCILMAIGITYQFFFQGFSKYITMLLLSTVIGIATYLIYRRINILNNFLFGACIAAILLLLIANGVFGEERNGARLWIDLKLFDFQPGELVKVLLILLGASAFQNPVRSVIYCATCLISCACLLLFRDLGGAVVIFALFILMVYLLFDNRLLSLGLIVAAVAGLAIALRLFPYANARFSSWFHAMDNPDSFQQRKYIIGILMGGFDGLGVEDHGLFTRVFAAENDGALAGVMAVLGVPMILLTLGSYALLAAQASLNRSVYTSSFLILAQMCVYIAVHVLLNFAGAADLLPFTGVVAPLISSGGSATLCFGMLLGLGAAALNPHLEYYREQ